MERIHSRKTGAMFRVSLRLGGIVGSASEQELAALDLYGRRLGLAFQIADELLDATGAVADVGKATGKDAAAGKKTFPTLLGVEKAREAAIEHATRAAGSVSVLGERAAGLVVLAHYAAQRGR